MAEAEVDPFAEKPQPREVWEPAEEENFDEVRESVEGRMDVNIPNPITQNTPLLIAIKNRNVEMAKYLIIRNSDVKMQNAVGDTALHWAVSVLMNSRSLFRDLSGIERRRRTRQDDNHQDGGNKRCRRVWEHSFASCLQPEPCTNRQDLDFGQEGASVTHRNDYGNTPVQLTTNNTIRQMIKLVTDKGEAGREQVKAAERNRLAQEKAHKEQQRLKQLEAEAKKRDQDAYDWRRREEILAEEVYAHMQHLRKLASKPSSSSKSVSRTRRNPRRRRRRRNNEKESHSSQKKKVMGQYYKGPVKINLSIILLGFFRWGGRSFRSLQLAAGSRRRWDGSSSQEFPAARGAGERGEGPWRCVCELGHG
ncbi:uncharacterized protein LOC9634610 isoform X1 [Selaginella moellendorffii]|uniref:uncharacterized protein LOC9634610 isoform X1 n=1 Tax=Selaginella moellendorffii TaxID=88036 RepID=UPI000D1C6E4A|nr:uncharacterized protein LOC9634610 isoform X1 [Selaginella moellendorffii]|eukprot:XP_024526655.1 uncharacterized protein LOC9634610 isoform X1 [Selaginella moellendorffii]